jgi:hypothetical protein
MRIKDYEGLFALKGYWRYKRAEKKKFFTDKSMRTRDAVMRNWIIPLWAFYAVVCMVNHAQLLPLLIFCTM